MLYQGSISSSLSRNACLTRISAEQACMISSSYYRDSIPYQRARTHTSSYQERRRRMDLCATVPQSSGNKPLLQHCCHYEIRSNDSSVWKRIDGNTLNSNFACCCTRVLNIVFQSKDCQCLICGGQIGTGTGFSSHTSVLFLLVYFYWCSTFIPVSITNGIHP
jgi:hypothetical protein